MKKSLKKKWSVKLLRFSFLLSLILSLNLLANEQHKSKTMAIASVKALFPHISKTNKLKTQGCKIDKNKWINLILTKKEFKEKYTFTPECDLQGSHTVMMDSFFPVDISVKNMKEFDKIKGQIKFEIVFEKMPLLKVYLKDMTLVGRKKLHFDMNYAVEIDLTNQNPLQKHQGGMLYLKKLGDEKLNKKLPINFMSS